MIFYIEGRLVEKTPTYAVIDCGGVGYVLNISLNTYSKIEDYERCKLLTHLAIKEDAHTLYGFADEAERDLFKLLISVSGIGANTARMMLSSLSTNEIQQAIVTGNVSLLKGIKGIGEKSAQRVIVDLRDKVGKQELSTISNLSFTPNNTTKSEALSALVILGFAKNVAEKALDKVISSGPKDLTVEQLIKLALKNI